MVAAYVKITTQDRASQSSFPSRTARCVPLSNFHNYVGPYPWRVVLVKLILAQVQCRPSCVMHDIDQLVFTSNFILPCHGSMTETLVHTSLACPFLAVPDLGNLFKSGIVGEGKNRVLGWVGETTSIPESPNN